MTLIRPLNKGQGHSDILVPIDFSYRLPIIISALGRTV